jgi:hypothetical protein
MRDFEDERNIKWFNKCVMTKQHEENMKSKRKQAENISKRKINDSSPYLPENGNRSSFRNVVYCSENQSMDEVQKPS